MHVVSVHVGIKSWADRLDDLGARGLVGGVEHSAEGTETGEESDELLLRHHAGNIDRLDVDLGPATCFQDAADVMLVREGELPGRARVAGRDVWEERGCGALRGCHERIFRCTPPGDEPERSVVPCGTPQVCESADGVAKEHDAKARHDHVEARTLEGMHLRIRADEACGGTAAFGALAGGSDYRIRNVNANAAAVRAESSRERECRAAGEREHFRIGIAKLKISQK